MSALSLADRRAYEANIWKSYVFQFLYSFQLWWPIWVLYLTDMRGFSLTQVSLLEALFWVVIVFAEVPTGAVADRFGRKTSLVMGAVCTVVGVLVFGMATGYWLVLASYVLWGVGLTFQSGADSALVFESLRAADREEDYPKVAGFGWALFSVGTVAGLLAGAPLASVTNLAVPVLASAGITVLALLVALTFKEPPVQEGERFSNYGLLLRESARTAWRSPAVRWMLLLAAVVLAAANPIIIFMQPFLEEHDVAVSAFGLAQAPMRVAGIVGAVIAYRIAATFGLRATFVAAPVLVAGSFFLLGGWGSVYAFGATAVIFFAHSMVMPLTSDYLNRRIPNNQRATILSLRQLLTSLAIVVLQPGLGIIADEVSLSAVFWATGAFVAVTAPPALYLWLRADAREPSEAPPTLEAGPLEVGAPGG